MHTVLNIVQLVRLSAIILIVLKVNNVVANFTVENCKSLGFNKPGPLRSTCDKFLNYDLSEIRENCLKCCSKDDDDSRRYPKAVLEVCTCKFGAYPQIQAFVKSDRPKKYKNLQIKYLRGSNPKIKLYDNENKLQDNLDIHKWNTDSIDEFFLTHLVMD
ncbi:hypothetical protein PV327_003072 [Microctonus hyperodae]|uniref:Selenoprotein F n=1 Tax=Microctonus hyperodae TaxID=165561 RepID=A0AA39L0S4_MICHY|nr:hypothetical protein PV327_003072 [Microctonus hyperodae]